MRDLIVYYSQSGNTDQTAKKLAEALGAGLVRLEPVKSYPDKGFRKFFWGGKSAVMAEAPALQPYAFDADGCDRVVFAFPVWASSFAPPIRTFLRENGEALRGKRVAAFACQSGNGAERAFRKLCEAMGRDALEARAVFIDPKDRPSAENDERLRAFIAALRGK